MTQTPSYPDEAAVGDAAADKSVSPGHADPQAGQADGSKTRNIVTGAAIGIGSAALVAALLYANRSRKSGNKKP
jgi:hypothetical protein